MPREIVCVQVGQCGNQLGCTWWDLMLQEHRANLQHADAISCLFYDGVGSNGKPQLKARCVPIDMEEGVLNRMLRGPLRTLFDTTHFVSDVSGAGNNWAVGYMEYGDKYVNEITSSVSAMAEKCDSLQAFLVLHSLSGGTGSGLGTRVVATLKDEFPNVFRFSPVVFPEQAAQDVVIAPYNTCFALRELIEHSDCVLPIGNDALASVVARATQPDKGSTASTPAFNIADAPANKQAAFDQMNAIAAQMLSNLTCSMRFPGSLNMDISDVTTNLVPYPRLHFLVSSLAPLSVTRHVLAGTKHVDAMFTAVAHDADHQLVTCPTRQSTYLASAVIARGKDISVSDVNRNLARVKERMKFAYWNADGFKTALCSVAPLGHPQSLLMLSNNCGIARTMNDVREQFVKLYSVRSHVHHYADYIEPTYFDDTLNIIGSVIDDYRYLDTAEPPRSMPRCIRDLLVL